VTIGLLAAGLAGLGVAVFGGDGARFSAGRIVWVAVLLRLLLVPLEPTLSDDVLRYVWDGRVALSGANPYALTPNADELIALRDTEWEVMPHREIEAVYPPLPLALFSIAAALPRPLLAWKILLTLVELGGCLLLLRLARSLGIELRRVALYAWNPLVTLEVAGMGHLDGIGVALAIAAVVALETRRRWGPFAAAGSVLTKLVPLVLIPIWARRAPRPVAFALLSLGLVALTLGPVAATVGGVPPGWVQFGVSWEFNGPLFEPLWRALDVMELDLAIKGGLDRLKVWSGAHDFWNRFYRFVYPQLLAKALLAPLLGWLLWRVWRDREAGVLEATGRSFAALILCSSTVYPWYVLWVLPWAALTLQRAWLVLSGLILLSYLPQFTTLPLMPWIFAAIWAPFFLLLLRHRSWSTD